MEYLEKIKALHDQLCDEYKESKNDPEKLAACMKTGRVLEHAVAAHNGGLSDDDLLMLADMIRPPMADDQSPKIVEPEPDEEAPSKNKPTKSKK